MARLDVYPWPGAPGRGYVVDLQTDLLGELRTRVVAPLVPLASATAPVRELNPVVQIGGAAHILLAQSLASISARELRVSVGSLQAWHGEINRALDLLLVGY